jgi:uncharacterized protein
MEVRKMNYVVFNDVNDFLEKVEPFLSENEASNNLPIGILYQRQNQGDQSDIYMALVENDDQILSIFVMTPPHYLIVTERLEGSIPFAVRSLLRDEIKIPGVLGQKNAAFSFAKEWSRQTGRYFNTKMNQRIYQLEEVSPIKISNGIMRLASLSELKLVQKWTFDFVRDTNEPTITIEQAENLALKKIKEKSVYLWIDQNKNKPVSMACRARSTKNTVVVNLVYTPDQERKKGYASSVVSCLSKKLLQEFSFCALYTDLDNPTSNKIYQDIGYKSVCDSVMIEFI